ncbi:MAG TPA: hypothetical protein VK599_15220 [Streptosporangiaceae bacterium]|nr:hypothetical protein [Streptosporangiaceae bacterium]
MVPLRLMDLKSAWAAGRDPARRAGPGRAPGRAGRGTGRRDWARMMR